MTGIAVETLEDPGSPSGTEDTLFVEARSFGVFDGATSLTALGGIPGPRGGAVAAGIARDVFAAGVDRDLVDLALEANRRIAVRMDAAGVDRSRPEDLWGTTAAVARITEGALDWLVVGDSVIVIIFEDRTFRPVAPLHDHDRATKRRAAALGVPATAVHERLYDDLVAVRARANIDYGVLNGDPAVARRIGHGREPLVGVRQVILFTDGLLPPRADPDAEDDLSPLVARFVSGGLASARDFVRSIEASDSSCTRYPRLKPRDDIAAIAVTLTPHI